MEVGINPITLETTKTLARLYPSQRSRVAQESSGAKATLARLPAYASRPSAQVLDSFFAADFIPPYQHGGSHSRTRAPQAGKEAAPVASGESYGVKYVRYLHQFARDQVARLCVVKAEAEAETSETETGEAEAVLVEAIARELAGRAQWEQAAREVVLAQAIVVQARIERNPQLLAAWGARLARAFWASRLLAGLWRTVQLHLHPAAAGGLGEANGSAGGVRADELEVAVELLFLFSNWSDEGASGPIALRAAQRVCLAVELFTKYARHIQRPRAGNRLATAAAAAADAAGSVGRVQRIRLGHKTLLLLEVTWSLLVGDEPDALRRISSGTEDAGGPARAMRSAGLARDALRQIRASVDKYPLLAPAVRGDVERLQPFVHPFDGHLTRTAQLGRFGPIRSRADYPRAAHAPMGSPSTRMLLADMQARLGLATQAPDGGGDPVPVPRAQPRHLGLTEPPPRAARDAIAAHVGCVRMTRSEREYAEWWHRLIRDRGLPLSLTLNGSTRRGASSDITINYADSAASPPAAASAPAPAPRQPPFEFCGIVEVEDLPALEMHLDGRDHQIKWPPSTAPEPEPVRASYAELYRALFPLLPALCKALVLTVVNWAPAERELPASRHALASYGLSMVSGVTCLGVVKYPPAPTDSSSEEALPPLALSATAAPSVDSFMNSDTDTDADADGGVMPTSPLGGSNVKRLLSSPRSDSSVRSTVSLTSGSDVSSAAAAAASSVRGPTSQQQLRQQMHAPAELSARLIAQYAQWQSVGGLLMRVMLSLQANHVLQADYMAQLLMNENLIPAFFWWLGTANLDLCVDLPLAIRAHSFMAEYVRGEMPQPQQDSTQGDAGAGGPEGEWTPALRGLYDCMRCLRRLTSHNGLRKGLLYKNKALYFYGRLLKLPHSSVRQIAAELYRDIMPVVSKKQKMQGTYLDSISHVYISAQPSLPDAFWLADFSLDPQIEMHRHVELLRLLHFYHHEAFALKLPRDPALFPSLVTQAVDALPPAPPTSMKSALAAENKAKSGTAAVHKSSCRQSGAALGEYSWLLWESDLEDTLNDVYSSNPKNTTAT
ncbi:hypothetical protein GGI04_003477 [Coemansia thaxteri]|uniref:Uncharacterized protein n=1 Tax=Coemansia thaxteri TaxID=2663907 RepID=A0A9W8BML8_9FUNG|nr:hypothetical protein GGI04_003477 [Coemansia thaxteri]KAJ2006771.1 hypothetical protein H4R26_001185 [Coemansia thaxteri]KAJ2486596.1 hypothetical protein EV174_001020 [Coemansia sp. RSA 2320]